MEKIIIERLNKKKQVIERVICKEFPVTIGRGYANDVIVSDPYVAEKQLVLTKEGDTWRIEMLADVNELFVNNVVQQEKFVEIRSGDEMSIGETLLRVISSTHKVPVTKKIFRQKEYLTNTQRIILAWGSVILALAFFSGLEFLETSRSVPPLKLLRTFAEFFPETIPPFWITSQPALGIRILAWALAWVAVPLVWTGMWTSIGRTLTLIPNFHRHLLIITIIAVAGRWALILSEYLQYMLNSRLAGKISLYLFAGILGIILLNTNLKLATTLSRWQRIGVTHVCVWGTVFLCEFLMIAQQPVFRQWTDFNATLKSPYVKVLSNKTADEFFADTDTLFQKVDKMGQKEMEKQR